MPAYRCPKDKTVLIYLTDGSNNRLCTMCRQVYKVDIAPEKPVSSEYHFGQYTWKGLKWLVVHVIDIFRKWDEWRKE